jgi:hypothetical protein
MIKQYADEPAALTHLPTNCYSTDLTGMDLNHAGAAPVLVPVGADLYVRLSPEEIVSRQDLRRRRPLSYPLNLSNTLTFKCFNGHKKTRTRRGRAIAITALTCSKANAPAQIAKLPISDHMIISGSPE